MTVNYYKEMEARIAALGGSRPKLLLHSCHNVSRADFDAVMETAVDDLASGRRPLGTDLEAAAHRTAEGMSLVQRRALKSIRSYTSERREEGAARLRRAVARVESERRARKHAKSRANDAGAADAGDGK